MSHHNEHTIEQGITEGAQMRMLWLGVLERMLWDAYGKCSRHGGALPSVKEQREARLWRASSSFDEVCYLAGLDPGYVRRIEHQAIEVLKDRQRAYANRTGSNNLPNQKRVVK